MTTSDRGTNWPEGKRIDPSPFWTLSRILVGPQDIELAGGLKAWKEAGLPLTGFVRWRIDPCRAPDGICGRALPSPVATPAGGP